MSRRLGHKDPGHDAKVATIRRLKRSINPKTGAGWKFAEIGAEMGFSKQNAIKSVSFLEGVAADVCGH